MERDFILMIQNTVGNIFQKFISIRVSINSLILSKGKTDIHIDNHTKSAQEAVAKVINSLTQEMNKKRNSSPDFNRLSNELYFAGTHARENKLHQDETVWNLILGLIRSGGFLEVSKELISLTEITQREFTNIKNAIQYTEWHDTKKIEGSLLRLETNLMKIMSYVSALLIMVNYIEEKGCEVTLVNRPALRLVQ